MATPTQLEIESFVGKFIQLSSCGYKSSLDLTASNGNICINFQTSFNIGGSIHEREKPARTRRRQRRKEKLGPMSSPSSASTTCNSTASDALNSELIVPKSLSTENPLTTEELDNTGNASSCSLLTSHNDAEDQGGNEVADAMCQVVNEVADVMCQTDPLQSRKPILSTRQLTNISIPPKTIYHPAIINATKSFYGKHPSELSPEECEKFNWYLEQQHNRGEPVESDIIYLPSSIRNCLHCILLT